VVRSVADRQRHAKGTTWDVYALSGEFAVLVGAGAARLRQFREYVDDTEDGDARITWEGNYLVPHSPPEQWKPQAVVHGMFRVGSRVAFSFGYETTPANMSLGACVMFPRGALRRELVAPLRGRPDSNHGRSWRSVHVSRGAAFSLVRRRSPASPCPPRAAPRRGYADAGGWAATARRARPSKRQRRSRRGTRLRARIRRGR
jgi:hypothetical protein